MTHVMKRLYHVVVVNDKTGKKVLMTDSPVTHDEGCIILSKLVPHKETRAVLRPVK